MSFLPPKPVRNRPAATQDFAGEGLKRTTFVFAQGGIVGLVGWLLRGEIRTATARYVTGPAAVAAMITALVLLAIGNNLHIKPLSFVAGWSLLIIPLA
jgi:hypothetical protein